MTAPETKSQRDIRRGVLVPWMSNARSFRGHGPKNNTAIRILIFVVTAAIIVLGGMVIYVSDIQQVNHRSRLQDEAVLTKQEAANQKELAEVTRELAEVKAGSKDLACSTYLYFRHQPVEVRPTPFLHFLDHRYGCQHYHPGIPLGQVIPSSSARFAPDSTKQPQTAASGPPASRTTPPATFPPRTPVPRRTHSSSAPAGHHPTTVTVTPSSTSAQTSSGVVCTLVQSLLGKCTLP